MASTPTDILSKLNVGSGMNTADIVTSLVDSERLPQLERIEKYENQTENRISAYGILKNDIKRALPHNYVYNNCTIRASYDHLYDNKDNIIVLHYSLQKVVDWAR